MSKKEGAFCMVCRRWVDLKDIRRAEVTQFSEKNPHLRRVKGFCEEGHAISGMLPKKEEENERGIEE